MRTPLTLLDELGLIPTLRQHVTLQRFEEGEKQVNLIGDDKQENARAVAIYALWRVLKTQGAMAIVLTPTQDRGAELMTFLDSVTQLCNPHLAQVAGFPRWNVLRINSQPSWEIRVMPNRAPLVREEAPKALVSVILDAKNPDFQFVEACKALEECSTHEKNTLVRVW